MGLQYSNFIFGIAYIRIDGALGRRDFSFGMDYIMIDTVHWGWDFLF